MKILVLAVHFEVTGARYIADALARLGHDVVHSGPEARLKDAWGADIPERYIWTPVVIPELTLSGKPIIGWKPDLIVIADTLTPDYVIPKPFRDVPAVVWSNDNHVRNSRTQQDDKHLIRHYFLAHYHGPAQPVTQPDETWLPCAYDPTVFTPSTIPWKQRSWDVAILGVMYPRRREIMNKMLAAGLKVYAETGLVYEEYAKVYQNARISLCVSAAGDVAQRVFETAAMGCTILTDPLLDLADDANGQSETNRKLGLNGFFVYQSDDEAVSLARELVTTESGMAQFGAATMQAAVRASHTWDQRAQVVIDWYNKEYGNKLILETPIIQNSALENSKPLVLAEKKAFLNLGCGKTHFPSAKPAGHELVDDAVYQYPLYVNVDKVEGVGADKVFDLFSYPWPLESNSYDGAVLAHIIEHIGHEIHSPEPDWDSFIDPVDFMHAFQSWKKTENKFKALQDGWICFWSELYRVLTPNALVHVVSPYGFSDGGITDFSHARYLTMNSFTHSMTPEISDGSTFKYNNGGINFVVDGNPQYRLHPYAELLKQRMGFEFDILMGTNLNVCYDFYIKLKCVK